MIQGLAMGLILWCIYYVICVIAATRLQRELDNTLLLTRLIALLVIGTAWGWVWETFLTK